MSTAIGVPQETVEVVQLTMSIQAAHTLRELLGYVVLSEVPELADVADALDEVGVTFPDSGEAEMLETCPPEIGRKS